MQSFHEQRGCLLGSCFFQFRKIIAPLLSFRLKCVLAAVSECPELIIEQQNACGVGGKLRTVRW